MPERTLSLEQRRSRLHAVVGREVSLDSLGCLADAISSSSPNYKNVGSSAIALDANVILRLPVHKKGADIIDYLSQRFAGPLILPAQAVQEFWNNNLSVIDTVGKKLKKRFNDLEKEAAQLGPEFDAFAIRINDLLADFDREFGYIYDESTLRKMGGFLETLKRKAYLSTIDGMQFFQIAEMRKKTKTPPGFRDEGHGDFFIWLEILDGAMKSIAEGHDFDRLILVSNDAKDDWVRDGAPHPILAAEVKELLEKPFEIWKLSQFIDAIETDLGE